ncbi:MAG: autotransporter protein [Candidatus Doudnabacteria bacterium]|nr:autotransporter protein [Candidatus Doudnabacteria bacterium]
MVLMLLTTTLFSTANIARAASLQILTSTAPNATVGQAYSTQLQVSGGTAPYTWSTLSTTYPSGCCIMGIDSTGVLNTQSSATVLAPSGTYSWNVQVTDAIGNTGTGVIYLTVNSATTPTLIVSDSVVSFNYTQGGSAPTQYPAHISNSSNSQTINYTISVPNQPAWLNTSYTTYSLPLNPLQTAGVGISVNPVGLAPGNYSTNIYFSGNFSNSPASITVNLTVTGATSVCSINSFTPSATSLTTGQAVTLNWSTQGCNTLRLVSTNVDKNIFTTPLSSNLSGSATTSVFSTPGTYYYRLAASPRNTSDFLEVSTTPGDVKQDLSFVVTAAPTNLLLITTNSLPNGTVGMPYAADVNFSYSGNGCVSGYLSYLPAGLYVGNPTSSPLTVNCSSGSHSFRILGTPVTGGATSPNATITISLTDNLGNMNSKTIPIKIDNNQPYEVANGPVSSGKNVIYNGTVYYIDGFTRKPYTSAGAFLSYSFNSWSTVSAATSSDMALPLATYTPNGSAVSTTAFVLPRNGTLINDKGTIYLISNGLRMGFANASAFLNFGYSFSNAAPGDTSFMVTLPPINSSNQAHPNGTLVRESNGTISVIRDGYRQGVPGMDKFSSWGLKVEELVPANSYDIALPITTQLQTRMSNQFDI